MIRRMIQDKNILFDVCLLKWLIKIEVKLLSLVNKTFNFEFGLFMSYLFKLLRANKLKIYKSIKSCIKYFHNICFGNIRLNISLQAALDILSNYFKWALLVVKKQTDVISQLIASQSIE